ncbi:MAG: prealbumin-like fold domain-containing protein [Actinomycetota bacterium]|nr:prealbumin-like fold domain-containing protein [Actinomycetota bacterium]
MPADSCFEFDNTETDINGFSSIDGKQGISFTATAGGTGTQGSYITFNNNRKEINVSLTKYMDGVIPPEESSFSFYLSEEGSENIEEIVLDTSNEWIDILKLKCGLTYTIYEEDHSCYVFDRIELDGVTDEDEDPEDNSVTFTATVDMEGSIYFYNQAHEIIVHKTDSSDGSDISGVEYTLYVSDGEDGYIQATDAWGEIIEPQVTNDSGLVNFAGLACGIYYVKETGTPVGYYADDTYHEVEVTVDYVSYTVELVNNPIPSGGGGETTTTTVTVAGIQEEEEDDKESKSIVEVLGIQELPYTGINMLILFILGIGLIGASIVLVASELRKPGKKNT